jgi:hypothetical protein
MERRMDTSNSVEGYLSALPTDQRAVLEKP